MMVFLRSWYLAAGLQVADSNLNPPAFNFRRAKGPFHTSLGQRPDLFPHLLGEFRLFAPSGAEDGSRGWSDESARSGTHGRLVFIILKPREGRRTGDLRSPASCSCAPLGLEEENKGSSTVGSAARASTHACSTHGYHPLPPSGGGAKTRISPIKMWGKIRATPQEGEQNKFRAEGPSYSELGTRNSEWIGPSALKTLDDPFLGRCPRLVWNGPLALRK